MKYTFVKTNFRIFILLSIKGQHFIVDTYISLIYSKYIKLIYVENKMKRQKIRKLLLIMAMLLFPITMWYFSPYVIIQGAMEGIVTGSFVTFSLMLFGSIFFGRFFCGYLCPAGGIQECSMMISEGNPKQGWKNYIKYVTWVIWIATVVTSFVLSKKRASIDVFYLTDHGISVSNIYCYVIYYGVVLLIFLPSVKFGKRIFCHYFCWMAPFMVIGTNIGRLLHIPGLHISADKTKCISCKQCNKTCPMSLNVETMVQNGKCKDSECILCGACVDTCPKKVLEYRFKND
jgi:ferredoxin-type protein NapH